MKNILSVFVVLSLLTGCASYKAAPLNSLSSQVIFSSHDSHKKDLLVVAKAFDKADCKRYLDRDVIAKGYQPVQIYIQNNSDKRYSFSLDRVSLPQVSAEEVANKVHTSTVGRAAGYGAAAIILWPFVIPAVVDSFKSIEANESLDQDFLAKVATQQTILPHASLEKVIFVPSTEYRDIFEITLIDQDSGALRSFTVDAH